MVSIKEFTSSIIYSFLGPNKSNKIVMKNEKAYVCRCALKLFEKTLLQDPLGSLVEETLLAHHTLYGCSTLSLLAMWYLWSEEFRLAVDEGYEIQDIVMTCQNILETVVVSLSKISVSIESMMRAKKPSISSVITKNKSSAASQVPIAIRYSSRHFSPSTQTIFDLDENYQEIDDQCLSLVQGFNHDDDLEIANLVSECWKKQRNTTKCVKFKTDRLLVCPITLPSSNCSVLEGLILKSNSDPSCYQHVKKADTNRALIINGSVTFEHTHLGFSPMVSVSAQKTVAEILVSEKEIWQKKCCKLILQLQIDILLIKDDIDPELANFCSTHSILVLSHLPWRTLKILCNSCQYSPCTYILDCDEKCTLKNVKLGEWKQEDASLPEQYFILNVNFTNMEPPLQSIVLCHPSPSVLKMKKHQLQHLLSRLSSAVQSGKLLPGGGRTEDHCYAFLKQSQQQIPKPADPRSKVITAIANGYQNYSKIISKKLELAEHPNKVHDDLSSKVSSWHSAMMLALVTLQCDTSIINGIEDCSKYKCRSASTL